MELPAVRRTQPSSKGQHFSTTHVYNGYMVNNNNHTGNKADQNVTRFARFLCACLDGIVQLNGVHLAARHQHAWLVG